MTKTAQPTTARPGPSSATTKARRHVDDANTGPAAAELPPPHDAAEPPVLVQHLEGHNATLGQLPPHAPKRDQQNQSEMLASLQTKIRFAEAEHWLQQQVDQALLDMVSGRPCELEKSPQLAEILVAMKRSSDDHDKNLRRLQRVARLQQEARSNADHRAAIEQAAKAEDERRRFEQERARIIADLDAKMAGLARASTGAREEVATIESARERLRAMLPAFLEQEINLRVSFVRSTTRAEVHRLRGLVKAIDDALAMNQRNNLREIFEHCQVCGQLEHPTGIEQRPPHTPRTRSHSNGVSVADTSGVLSVRPERDEWMLRWRTWIASIKTERVGLAARLAELEPQLETELAAIEALRDHYLPKD